MRKRLYFHIAHVLVTFLVIELDGNPTLVGIAVGLQILHLAYDFVKIVVKDIRQRKQEQKGSQVN